MSFGEFYTPIRNHFTLNASEGEKFKQAAGNRGKIGLLLNHAVVQKSLRILEEKVKLVPPCSIFGIPQKSDPKTASKIKGSQKFPQMSQKVQVQSTDKQGRFLVAKDDIEPGKHFRF